MIDTSKIPECFDKAQYVKGWNACEKGAPVSPDEMNDSWYAGYSDCYHLEQQQTAMGLGNYGN